MSVKPIHAKPSMYCFFFEEMKVIAKDFGYNLVLHGSMNRDLDLIAIPWVDDPKPELDFIKACDMFLRGSCFNGGREDYMFSVLPGGRSSYVLNLNRGGKWNNYTDVQYYIDISFTPLLSNLKNRI